MLKKTFAFLRGGGIGAHVKACALAKAAFVGMGTLKAEDAGRVTVSNQGDWFFCRVRGAHSGMKDYEWFDEVTVGNLVIRPGVWRGLLGKKASRPVAPAQLEAEEQTPG